MTTKFTPEEIGGRRWKAAYGRLVGEVTAILCRHDPVGICDERNPDEYAPEAASIVAKLRDCASVADAQRAAHRVFVGWFDRDTAGPESRYAAPAAEIWVAWQAILDEKKSRRK
jgi:hypothetical protein